MKALLPREIRFNHHIVNFEIETMMCCNCLVYLQRPKNSQKQETLDHINNCMQVLFASVKAYGSFQVCMVLCCVSGATGKKFGLSRRAEGVLILIINSMFSAISLEWR